MALRSIPGTQETSRSLFRLGLLLHVGSQHCIHPALIAVALTLEIIEHVFIDANGDRLLPCGDDQNGVGPVDIDGRGIGIVSNGLGDVLIAEFVNASPISLALPRRVP
jgi:hypothetical protein